MRAGFSRHVLPTMVCNVYHVRAGLDISATRSFICGVIYFEVQRATSLASESMKPPSLIALHQLRRVRGLLLNTTGLSTQVLEKCNRLAFSSSAERAPCLLYEAQVYRVRYQECWDGVGAFAVVTILVASDCP